MTLVDELSPWWNKQNQLEKAGAIFSLPPVFVSDIGIFSGVHRALQTWLIGSSNIRSFSNISRPKRPEFGQSVRKHILLELIQLKENSHCCSLTGFNTLLVLGGFIASLPLSSYVPLDIRIILDAVSI